MPSSRRTPLLALASLALLLAALALSACGASNDETQDLMEGEPVKLGNIEYNVIFSRYLNVNDNEDSAYLVGQPPVDKDGLYFGVFLQIKNASSDETAKLPAEFTIEDTSHARYPSIPSDSLFALPLDGVLEPEMALPIQDSTAQTGPIEGVMVLFQIPQTATENRPLKLVIPGEDEDATINLDL